jgi:magnesium chelatase subunit I
MPRFPFVAIVGMELAKRSLIYHAIDPRIGGVLLLGQRGSAKTTLARGSAELFSTDQGEPAPFVEVPLGTTEDRLLGSVDAEALVEGGCWSHKPGLLEQANHGLLYIDEINLLPDHLADLLLDSAATGSHRIEREGFSRTIESRYVLIGTMNPDEGDLRPQLADRFAHGVRIETQWTEQERVEIVARRMEFEDAPAPFLERFAQPARVLNARIREARKTVRSVTITDAQRRSVAQRAGQMRLEGLRAELAVLRTARCAAAFHGRRELSSCDLEEAWELCLGHREFPDDPETLPPPRAPLHSEKSSPRQVGAATSTLPAEARREPIPLPPLAPDGKAGLQNWFAGAVGFSRRMRRTRFPGLIEGTSRAPIDWIASLVATRIRASSQEKQCRWVLRTRTAGRRTGVWIFLDASRSTGVGHFLQRACGRLVPVIKSKAGLGVRFHVLVLQHGTIRWLVRNGSAARTQSRLHTLGQTAGKSFLPEALNALRRMQHRRRDAEYDPLLICSDGFLSPRPGENPHRAVQRFRNVLAALTGTRKTAWLYPVPKRSAASWLPRLTAGCDVQPYEIR